MPKQAPKMEVLGDFGPLNMIIHYRDPQKEHPYIYIGALVVLGTYVALISTF